MTLQRIEVISSRLDTNRRLGVPANRSKTTRWRDCLTQIRERDGALELAVDRGEPAEQEAAMQEGVEHTPTHDIVWRVRLFEIDDEASELIIEQPTAAQQTVKLDDATELVITMSVGQNRWMFHTEVLGKIDHSPRPGRNVTALRIRLPEKVERCQRRNYFRISTASLSLPKVRCWPLLDRASANTIEQVNREVVSEAIRLGELPVDPQPLGLPDVGAEFNAMLLNIGGGGVGLLVPSSGAHLLDRAPFFWLQVDLSPTVPAPLGLTTKLCHTRLDATHSVQAGMSFDFTGHAGHEKFVADQVCRYVAELQRQQTHRAA